MTKKRCGECDNCQEFESMRKKLCDCFGASFSHGVPMVDLWNKLQEQWPCYSWLVDDTTNTATESEDVQRALLTLQRRVSQLEIWHWTKDEIEQWHSQQHQGLPKTIRACLGCGCLISTGTTCKRCEKEHAAAAATAEKQEHLDTGPHEGCQCVDCQMTKLEQQAVADMRWGGGSGPLVGALLKRMGVRQVRLNPAELLEGSVVSSYDPADKSVTITLVRRK